MTGGKWYGYGVGMEVEMEAGAPNTKGSSEKQSVTQMPE